MYFGGCAFACFSWWLPTPAPECVCVTGPEGPGGAPGGAGGPWLAGQERAPRQEGTHRRSNTEPYRTFPIGARIDCKLDLFEGHGLA